MLEALIEPARDDVPRRRNQPAQSQAVPFGYPRERWSRARQLRVARGTGFCGALAMLLFGGHLAAPIDQVPPTRWLRLLGAFPEPWQRGVAGGFLISGLVMLAGAFLHLARMALDGRVTVREVTMTALLWSVPFLIGPPLLSLDVHSYVAHGAMLDRGIDPYQLGPEFIRGPVYDAVDPRWRAAHAPYGPLALLLSRGAYVAGHHSPTWAVIVLRAVAFAAVVITAWVVTRLAANRAFAMAVTGASPLVLVTCVSSIHHEALMTMLVVAAVAAQRARREFLALALASAALADKLPGAVALGAIGFCQLLDATGWASRAWVVVRGGLAVAAVWVPLALLVPDPLGWVRALSTPGLGRTGYAPVTIVAYLTHIPENGVRAASEVLSVFVVARLILTLRRRSLQATVGWGLFAVALLGPVLYTWYLVPAAVMLSTCATGPARFIAAAAGAEGLLAALPRTLRRQPPLGVTGDLGMLSVPTRGAQFSSAATR